MTRMFTQFVREDRGQDVIEYALLAGFISVVAITMITNVGNDVIALFTTVHNALT